MRTLITIAAMAVTTISIAQASQQVLHPIGTPAAASADTMANETIEHCDAMIRAVDNKVAYVESDQNQREAAVASGWFQKMAYTRARYVARKEALINAGATR
jgi:hypothetical protein